MKTELATITIFNSLLMLLTGFLTSAGETTCFIQQREEEL
jgi:hypothetical protein